VLALAGSPAREAPAAATSDATVDAALAAGRSLYAFDCSVCHGPTGGGLEEARLAFPPEHRRCTRCHKPNNPVVMPLDRPFVDNDMFAIGTPPALHGAARDAAADGAPLSALARPEALFAYLRATMPRYDPGRETDLEYWLLTAHLLDMNGRAEAAREAVGAAVALGFTAP